MKKIILSCLLLLGLTLQPSFAGGDCSSGDSHIYYNHDNLQSRYWYAFVDAYVNGCQVDDQKTGISVVMCDTNMTGHCPVNYSTKNSSSYGMTGTLHKGKHYQFRVAARYKKWYQKSRWKIIDSLEEILFYEHP